MLTLTPSAWRVRRVIAECLQALRQDSQEESEGEYRVCGQAQRKRASTQVVTTDQRFYCTENALPPHLRLRRLMPGLWLRLGPAPLAASFHIRSFPPFLLCQISSTAANDFPLQWRLGEMTFEIFARFGQRKHVVWDRAARGYKDVCNSACQPDSRGGRGKESLA